MSIALVLLIGGGGVAVATGQFDALFEANALPSPSATATATPTRTPSSSPTPTLPPVPTSPADTPCDSNVAMSVWAHYDDDLIFFNPVLQDTIASDECVRTVFLTGADAGRGMNYSQERELGILRAYNVMRGQEGQWIETPVTLLSGATLSQWSPEGDPRITISFLRLPDGNLTGEGFPSTGNVSLPQLLHGQISEIAPLEHGAPITSGSLVASIVELIGAYQPDRLTTSVPSTAPQFSDGDHPDHATTGTFTRQAWQQAAYPAAQVSYAVGYPSEYLPANVSGDALTRKLATFRVYAALDPVVTCDTDADCLALNRFGDWLQRNHLKSEAELFPNG